MFKNLKFLFIERKKWKILRTQVIFEAKPWFVVARQKLKLSNNKIVKTFYQIETPSYVEVIPFNKKLKVLLNLKYKHGVRGASLGFPSGYLGKNEAPIAAAKRELQEESGLIAKKFEYLGGFTIDGNRGRAKAHFVAAFNCKKGKKIKSDDLEQGVSFWTSQKKLISLFNSGYFRTLGAATAFYYAVNKLRKGKLL
jgi:8-oxo-dGTP pyrophosphatase MutT (NUDIX family)